MYTNIRLYTSMLVLMCVDFFFLHLPVVHLPCAASDVIKNKDSMF